MNAEATSDAVDVAGGGGFRGVSYRQLLGFAARPLILLAVAMVVAGGDEISVALEADGDVFYVRTINLIEGAPRIELMLGDRMVSSAAYGSGTGFNAVPSGNAHLSLKTAATAHEGGVMIDLGSKTTLAFEENTPYTLIAYGGRAAPHLFAVEAWGQRDNVADEKVVLQFAHAAPRAPQMDVYVTVAEAGTTISRYIATLALTEASVPLELTLSRDSGDAVGSPSRTGEAVVELRAHGSGETLYKSSEISIAARHRVLFAIADANQSGAASVTLVRLDGAMSGPQ